MVSESRAVTPSKSELSIGEKSIGPKYLGELPAYTQRPPMPLVLDPENPPPSLPEISIEEEVKVYPVVKLRKYAYGGREVITRRFFSSPKDGSILLSEETEADVPAMVEALVTAEEERKRILDEAKAMSQVEEKDLELGIERIYREANLDTIRVGRKPCRSVVLNALAPFRDRIETLKPYIDQLSRERTWESLKNI